MPLVLSLTMLILIVIYWIIGYCNSRALIGLAIMVHELLCSPNMVNVRVSSKLKTSWKSVVVKIVGKNSRYFVGVFNKTIIIIPLTLKCWIWDDYSQLSTTHLIGYLKSHIQIMCTHEIIMLIRQCSCIYTHCLMPCPPGLDNIILLLHDTRK